MSAEHPVDPEIRRALDSVFEELRTEEAALDRMQPENDRLRARLDRLQRGRANLREALKQGLPGLDHHLPEELEIPFHVRAPLSGARRQRDVLSLIVLGLIAIALQWAHRGAGMVTLFCVLAGVSAIRLTRVWRKSRSWFFLEQGVEAWDTWKDRKPARFVRYSEMLGAEVRVTPSQRRQGVGTVVVRYRPAQDAAEQSLVIKDAPEPERLVKWIRARALSVQ